MVDLNIGTINLPGTLGLVQIKEKDGAKASVLVINYD